jgi:hypothetical protein
MPRPKAISGLVEESLRKHGGEASLDTIYADVERQQSGTLRHSIRSALNRAVADGRVQRVARGQYRLRR